MHKTIVITLLACLLLISCTSQPEDNQPANSIYPPNSDIPTDDLEIQQLVETCLDDPDHPIGTQIAAEYPDQTSYHQVMTWFCSGFEFEDILTALQTAEISEFPADFLLTMLEYGQSWEEIWVEIGLE